MNETTVLRIEDILLIAGILPLWLPVLGYLDIWVWVILALDLAVMLVITYRRVRRFARLKDTEESLPVFQPPKGWRK